jgi:hypothetical protein
MLAVNLAAGFASSESQPVRIDALRITTDNKGIIFFICIVNILEQERIPRQ